MVNGAKTIFKCYYSTHYITNQQNNDLIMLFIFHMMNYLLYIFQPIETKIYKKYILENLENIKQNKK